MSNQAIRQSSKSANGQMGKWANGQMGKWANGQMSKSVNLQMGNHALRSTLHALRNPHSPFTTHPKSEKCKVKSEKLKKPSFTVHCSLLTSECVITSTLFPVRWS